MSERTLHEYRPGLVPEQAGTRIRNAVFGDRLGLIVFLGTMIFAMLYWRAGIFITDSETLTRTLRGLSDGHFWIQPVSAEAMYKGPGVAVGDKYTYGRNYGQLVVSLPFLWLVKFLNAIVDLRAGFIALWHLLGLTLVVQLGHLFDRKREFAIGGSMLVFSSFLVNLLFARQFLDVDLELLALQLTTLVATGMIAVVLYRLVRLKHDRRLGALVGAATVFVLPVGFWATIPKRHIFSTLVCLLLLYLFARSRNADESGRYIGSATLYRAAMYGLVGFLTWIHAAEGLFVFMALLVVDIPTAPKNDWRTLSIVGAVFALSLLPTVLTNLFVTGDLFKPPRTLGGSGITTPAAVEEVENAQAASQTESTQTATEASNSLEEASEDKTFILQFLIDFLVTSPFWWLIENVTGIISHSLAVLSNGDRLSQIFVQSSTENIGSGNIEFRAVNLSVLEVFPLLGAGVAIVAGEISRYVLSAGRRVRDREFGLSHHPFAQSDPTAMLAVALIITYLLVYLSRLPLHVQITQRYILPVYPLALYLMTHSTTLRRLVSESLRPLLWSYGAGTLLGTQLFITYIVQENLAVAEAARVNATLSLLAALAVTVAVLVYAVTDRFQRVAAITLGLACASGTLFLLVSGIHYFSVTGQPILPLVEFVSDLLAPYR